MKQVLRKTETRKTLLFAAFVVLVLAALSVDSRATTPTEATQAVTLNN